MSIIKMRGPIDVLFAFKIFSLPVPTRPGTRTFWQVPDPSRPEVKNPYPSDPAHEMMIVGRWNDMLTGGMMFQVGGMMCKVVALLLQMAENHLDSH